MQIHYYLVLELSIFVYLLSISGININCIIIPGSASINPPARNIARVNDLPAIPNSIHFASPHTILPANIADMSET